MSEELGFKIQETIALGPIAPNTGLLSGTAEAFLVRLEAGDPEPHPEQEEAFGAIVSLTVDQIVEKLRSGELRDGYTLSALLLAQAHNLLNIF